MSKIPSKFLTAIQGGQEFPVRYRWGETFSGETEWTEWDKGLLAFQEKANAKDEPGVNILDETGWGYSGREKALEDAFGKTIFGRFAEPGDTGNQHLLQVEFQA
jgi:hypothetical protein